MFLQTALPVEAQTGDQFLLGGWMRDLEKALWVQDLTLLQAPDLSPGTGVFA